MLFLAADEKGQPALTHINLATCESRTETLGEPSKSTAAEETTAKPASGKAAPAKAAPVEAAQVQPPPSDTPLPPLLLCRYDDPIQTRDRLCDVLAQANRVPVFWSRTRGLQLLDASRRAALDDDVPGDALRDPAAKR